MRVTLSPPPSIQFNGYGWIASSDSFRYCASRGTYLQTFRFASLHSRSEYVSFQKKPFSWTKRNITLSMTFVIRQVAACIRSKDYGRFLPEWVAFHYALGVDEVNIFDDESVDRTAQALLPFIDAGIVKYELGKIIL